MGIAKRYIRKVFSNIAVFFYMKFEDKKRKDNPYYEMLY